MTTPTRPILIPSLRKRPPGKPPRAEVDIVSCQNDVPTMGENSSVHLDGWRSENTSIETGSLTIRSAAQREVCNERADRPAEGGVAAARRGLLVKRSSIPCGTFAGAPSPKPWTLRKVRSFDTGGSFTTEKLHVVDAKPTAAVINNPKHSSTSSTSPIAAPFVRPEVKVSLSPSQLVLHSANGEPLTDIALVKALTGSDVIAGNSNYDVEVSQHCSGLQWGKLLCMCACTHMHMRMYAHKCMGTRVFIHTHTYAHAQARTRTRTHTRWQ